MGVVAVEDVLPEAVVVVVGVAPRWTMGTLAVAPPGLAVVGIPTVGPADDGESEDGTVS